MTVVHVVVAGTATIRDASPEVVARIKGALTMANPDLRSWSRRPNGPKPPPTISLWRHLADGTTLEVPRGAVALVERAVVVAGHQVVVDRRTVSTSTRRVPVADLGVVLRDYQLAAVERMLSSRDLIVEAAPGSGKTVIACAAIVASGESAIVVAPTIDIVDQWVEELRRMGADRVRTVKGGASLRPLLPGEVVVATTRAFRGRPEEDALLRSAGALVIDECHHIASPASRGLTARCPAEYRWGLSATVDRPDGWHVILPLIVGPRWRAASSKSLIANESIGRPLVIPVRTGWEVDHVAHRERVVACPTCGVHWTARAGSTLATCRDRTCRASLVDAVEVDRELDWAVAEGALSEVSTRMRVVDDLAVAAVGLGLRCLVLVSRVASVDAHVARLRARDVSVGGASGESTRSDRSRRVAQFRDGALSCLVASKIADEGFNVAGLDVVVLASPGRARGRATQRSGRATRSLTGVVFDLVDGGGELESQWQERRRAYVAEYGRECLHASEPVSVDQAIALLRARVRGYTSAGGAR